MWNLASESFGQLGLCWWLSDRPGAVLRWSVNKRGYLGGDGTFARAREQRLCVLDRLWDLRGISGKAIGANGSFEAE